MVGLYVVVVRRIVTVTVVKSPVRLSPDSMSAHPTTSNIRLIIITTDSNFCILILPYQRANDRAQHHTTPWAVGQSSVCVLLARCGMSFAQWASPSNPPDAPPSRVVGYRPRPAGRREETLPWCLLLINPSNGRIQADSRCIFLDAAISNRIDQPPHSCAGIRPRRRQISFVPSIEPFRPPSGVLIFF